MSPLPAPAVIQVRASELLDGVTPTSTPTSMIPGNENIKRLIEALFSFLPRFSHCKTSPIMYPFGSILWLNTYFYTRYGTILEKFAIFVPYRV